MKDTQEIISMMALSHMGYYDSEEIKGLYQHVGSAKDIMDHRKDIRQLIPDASQRLVEKLSQADDHLRLAEAEWEWDQRNGIQVLCLGDEQYPQRLNDIADAPLVVYFQGSGSLNATHVVSIVGTRHCTAYGQDLIRSLIAGLRGYEQDLIIVSGLAYGVDINAHRQSVANNFATVGVLAHGLDTLYPPRHRETAEKMCHHGGLLTEYMTKTKVDKVNFVRRNRIIAGLADATILVESAAHGGGMITCRVAASYGRQVFAFPGPVGATYSEGCHHLIRKMEATLITSADDFEEQMGWDVGKVLVDAQRKGIERQMFPELSPDEAQIVQILKKDNDLQVNTLVAMAGLPIAKVTTLLFSLEMKGVVRALPGAVYHLIG